MGKVFSAPPPLPMVMAMDRTTRRAAAAVTAAAAPTAATTVTEDVDDGALRCR